MSDVGKRDDLMRRALEVFQQEVGPGLIHAHAKGGDPLFSPEGILEYAKDALQRMVNPFLNDPIERVTRDPVRKLGWEDRLIGAMRLALDAGVEPLLLSEGAKIALARASKESDVSPQEVLTKIWSAEAPKEETQAVLSLLLA
jgi:mannitol-1-phosphate 5-dehydrogenase